MKAIQGVSLSDVQAVYGGPEGRLWELIMGEQVHIGGYASSMALAERAGIAPGSSGVDLCCCSGAGMRFLVHCRGVGRMTGVDATAEMVELGQSRCREEGLAGKIDFVQGDASATRLPAGKADFVWGEDAWCYVLDKAKLIAEAIRIVRPGGIIAFTDWVEGPTPLSDAQAQRFLRFMKFPNMQDLGGYRGLLEAGGAKVTVAEHTGLFAPCMDLYLDMLAKQLTYDALKIIGFDMKLMQALGAEMQFAQELAHAGKISQAMFVAKKPG
jgi:ubiquinone/menaquinone biosynthesis C-methylase UbiE